MWGSVADRLKVTRNRPRMPGRNYVRVDKGGHFLQRRYVRPGGHSSQALCFQGFTGMLQQGWSRLRLQKMSPRNQTTGAPDWQNMLLHTCARRIFKWKSPVHKRPRPPAEAHFGQHERARARDDPPAGVHICVHVRDGRPAGLHVCVSVRDGRPADVHIRARTSDKETSLVHERAWSGDSRPSRIERTRPAWRVQAT